MSGQLPIPLADESFIQIVKSCGANAGVLILLNDEGSKCQGWGTLGTRTGEATLELRVLVQRWEESRGSRKGRDDVRIHPRTP